MTIAYNIITTDSGYTLIESGGFTFAEEDLCDAIWLVNREIRAGLPKGERIEAQRQIMQYQTLLNALRGAGG